MIELAPLKQKFHIWLQARLFMLLEIYVECNQQSVCVHVETCIVTL